VVNLTRQKKYGELREEKGVGTDLTETNLSSNCSRESRELCFVSRISCDTCSQVYRMHCSWHSGMQLCERHY